MNEEKQRRRSAKKKPDVNIELLRHLVARTVKFERIPRRQSFRRYLRNVLLASIPAKAGIQVFNFDFCYRSCIAQARRGGTLLVVAALVALTAELVMA
jgi:hypothetical protein